MWLKKDARLHDHGPLTIAARSREPFCILYMYEPDQLRHPTVHGSHVAFCNEGLAALDKSIRNALGDHTSAKTALSGEADQAGGVRKPCILFRIGEATKILEDLHTTCNINMLLAHEETGHGASFDRDKRVRRFCRGHGIRFLESTQNGVSRGLKDRDNFTARCVFPYQHARRSTPPCVRNLSPSSHALPPFIRAHVAAPGCFFSALMKSRRGIILFEWYAMILHWRRYNRFMAEPQHATPTFHPGEGGDLGLLRNLASCGLQTPAALAGQGLLAPRHSEDRPERQLGGEEAALSTMESWMRQRGEGFQRGISAPGLAWSSCSRLSA